MKKVIGGIMALAGLAGTIYYTIQYMDDSESFEVLGADVAVSTGDYVPIIISVAVLIIGLLITRIKE